MITSQDVKELFQQQQDLVDSMAAIHGQEYANAVKVCVDLHRSHIQAVKVFCHEVPMEIRNIVVDNMSGAFLEAVRLITTKLFNEENSPKLKDFTAHIASTAEAMERAEKALTKRAMR